MYCLFPPQTNQYRMSLAEGQWLNEETISLYLSVSDFLCTPLAALFSPPSEPRDEWLTEEWRKYPATGFLSSCNAVHAGVSVSAWRGRICVRTRCTVASNLTGRVSLHVGSVIAAINICMFIAEHVCFRAACVTVGLCQGWLHRHEHTCTRTNI